MNLNYKIMGDDFDDIIPVLPLPEPSGILCYIVYLYTDLTLLEQAYVVVK